MVPARCNGNFSPCLSARKFLPKTLPSAFSLFLVTWSTHRLSTLSCLNIFLILNFGTYKSALLICNSLCSQTTEHWRNKQILSFSPQFLSYLLNEGNFSQHKPKVGCSGVGRLWRWHPTGKLSRHQVKERRQEEAPIQFCSAFVFWNYGWEEAPRSALLLVRIRPLTQRTCHYFQGILHLPWVSVEFTSGCDHTYFELEHFTAGNFCLRTL